MVRVGEVPLKAIILMRVETEKDYEELGGVE